MVVDPIKDYNVMGWSDGANVDVIATGAPTGRYQLLLAQSADTGSHLGSKYRYLSNDTAHTYFLPDMVRNGPICMWFAIQAPEQSIFIQAMVVLPGILLLLCPEFVLLLTQVVHCI